MFNGMGGMDIKRLPTLNWSSSRRGHIRYYFARLFQIALPLTAIRASTAPLCVSRGLLQSSSTHFQPARLPESFQSKMHFTHSFVLSILPFFTAAIPLAQPPTSRGIAIPIAKRASSSGSSNNTLLYATQVQNSVA